MIIELLKCQGCWRIWDNFSYTFGCDSCYSKFCKRTQPTKSNLIKWFLSNPKHVIKLIYWDIMGKCRE